MREVIDVVDRCHTCGQAIGLAMREEDLDEEGRRRVTTWQERIPHKRRDCEQMVTLMREQWPTLW